MSIIKLSIKNITCLWSVLSGLMHTKGLSCWENLETELTDNSPIVNMSGLNMVQHNGLGPGDVRAV